MWLLSNDSSPILFENLEENEKILANELRTAGFYSSRLERAASYAEVWTIVKETVQNFLGKTRVGMMLFLDDLPLNLGAYHPVGTNNIVLNKSLVEIVEASAKTQLEVNAFTYTLLTHEYLHALGYLSEAEVRHLVYKISKAHFGKTHITTQLAQNSPWALLNKVPINSITAPKGALEIVKDFERSNQNYIV
jgi:hypothetical protein